MKMLFLNGTCFLPFFLPFILIYYWKDICKSILDGTLKNWPNYLGFMIEYAVIASIIFGIISIVISIILDYVIRKIKKQDAKCRVLKIIKKIILVVGILVMLISVSIYLIWKGIW